MVVYPGEQEARQQVVRVCRLLWERGYVAATDGNVSVRIGAERLVATPSGHSKGFLSTDQLVLTNLDGTMVSRAPGGEGEYRPSSELRMHCSAYRERPDIGAVVHAHPPMATACTVAGVSLAESPLPEVLVNLGGIPTAAYARPSSAEGADVIRELIRDYDALLLPHHGSLTVGSTAFEAYLKLEKVENAALVQLAISWAGATHGLAAQEVEQLLAIYRQHRGGTLG